MCSYEAGNVGSSITDVSTNIRIKVLKQTSDSLFAESRYKVPVEYRKSSFYDSTNTNHKDYFLKGIPNEIYTISMRHFSVFSVYNIDKNEYHGNRDEFTDEERRRIEKRVQETLLPIV